MAMKNSRGYGKRIALMALLAAILFISSGCAVRTFTIRTATEPIIDGGFEAMMAEDDLVLAKTSLESNLKLIEGMLRSDPKNNRLRLLAAQGFTAYALGFIEDVDPERAKRMYARGRMYAQEWLLRETGVNFLAINRLDEFDTAVSSLPKKALPGVFWLGNAWASMLMLSLDDMSAVSDLPRVESLMRFVVEHDEAYYFGGAHLFYCGYYGSRPRMLGGNPDKAREHIERQIELTGGTMLLGQVFQVKYVDLATLDEEAARKHLNEILSQDPKLWPEDRVLVNRIAQAKALFLLEHLEDYL